MKMRLVKTLIISLSLLYVDQSFAGFKSGNDLYIDMLDYNKPEAHYGGGVYLWYVIGLADVMDGVVWCSQDGVTAGQLAKIVGKFLEQNLEQTPEMLRLSGDMLVGAALKQSFPCKK